MKKSFLPACFELLSSCGEDPKTPEELALEKFSGDLGISYTLGKTG